MEYHLRAINIHCPKENMVILKYDTRIILNNGSELFIGIINETVYCTSDYQKLRGLFPELLII